VPASIQQVYIDDPDNRELVTAVEYISAGGYHVPAIVIFKRAYHLRKYFDNNMSDDTLFACSDSSFTNNKLTLS
jgi:hypothetical protein